MVFQSIFPGASDITSDKSVRSGSITESDSFK